MASSVPSSPRSGSAASTPRLTPRQSAAKAREIIYRCQLWLFQEEKKHIKARLQDGSRAFNDAQARLHKYADELSESTKTHQLLLDQYERQEQEMRAELDRLSITIVERLKADRKEEAQRLEEDRRVLWQRLETIIAQRNHERQLLEGMESTHLLVMCCVGGQSPATMQMLGISFERVDRKLRDDVDRLVQVREEKSKLRRKLRDLQGRRDRFVEDSKRPPPLVLLGNDLSEEDLRARAMYARSHRQILLRVGEEIQRSGLLRAQGATDSSHYVGAALVDWVLRTGIVESQQDGQIFCDLLRTHGLVDIIRPASAPESPRYSLYRFRSALDQRLHNKSGWLWKLTRWRQYRRWFVWDADLNRLAYYRSNSDVRPKAEYWLRGGATSIKALKEGPRASPDRFIFQIQLPERQQGEEFLLVAADSAEGRVEWLRTLWVSGCSWPRHAQRLQKEAEKLQTEDSPADAGDDGEVLEGPLEEQQAEAIRQFGALHMQHRLELTACMDSIELQLLQALRLRESDSEDEGRPDTVRSPAWLEETPPANQAPALAPLVDDVPDEAWNLDEYLQMMLDVDSDDELHFSDDEDGGGGRKALSAAELATLEAKKERQARRQEVGQAKLESLREDIQNKLRNPEHPVGRLFHVHLALFQGLYGKALQPFERYGADSSSACGGLVQPRFDDGDSGGPGSPGGAEFEAASFTNDDEKANPADDGYCAEDASLSEEEVAALETPAVVVWVRQLAANLARGQTGYAGALPGPFPYPRYLRRVASSAKADIEGFSGKLRTLVTSESVIGPQDEEVAVSPGLLGSFCAELISRNLFKFAYSAVMPLYQAIHAEQDHRLAQAAALGKQRPLRWSEMGLDPSLCLEERLEQLKASGAVAADVEPPEDMYMHAVEIFCQLQTRRDPTSKLNTIVATAQELCRCVDLFVKRYEPPETSAQSQPAVIMADDLLILFTRVILRAGLPHLMAEINFMDDFMLEQKRVTMGGYYLATTRAAAELLLSGELFQSGAKRPADSFGSSSADEQHEP